MKKKGMAAVALAATMVSPAVLSAVSVVAPGVFVASAAEATEYVNVTVKVNGLEANTKGSLKVEFTDKKNPVNKSVWDSVADAGKEFKLAKGSVYTVKIVGTPDGYTAQSKEAELTVPADASTCEITIDAIKGMETPNPNPGVMRGLEVHHVDVDTKKPIDGAKVELSEKGKGGAVATIDFYQKGKNVVPLEVGKTYLLTFTENYPGYENVKDVYEVTIEPNAEGKVENQVLVVESKKIDGTDEQKAIEKRLVLQNIDKATNKEIKAGEVEIYEEGQDPKSAQKYDFSREDNNVKVAKGKSYVITFTKSANGYKPVSQVQVLKVDFPETDGADTYVAKVYSEATGMVQGNGNNTGSGSSTGLPATGVVASSIGVAALGTIASGFGIFRKRK